MVALVRALTARGGSTTPNDAYAWIAGNTNLVDRVPPLTKASKDVHFEREVRFARQELADAGVLASVEGAWQLLESAFVCFTADDAMHIIRENTRRRRRLRDDIQNTRQPPTRLAGEAGTRQTVGPKPAEWERTIKHLVGPAFTYAFRFERSELWKIGFSGDVEARLREVNQHVPVELLDQRWLLVRNESWPSADLAYAMEQAILRELKSQRTVYERVRCSKDALNEAWKIAFDEIARYQRRISQA